MAKKKDINLKVVTIGEPNIDALSDAERRVFLKSLLDIIIEKKQEDDRKKEENNNKSPAQ